VAGTLLAAATAFQHQLPEVFAGFGRDDAEVPVRYPAALTPQAWAAGAPLLALRTLLDLDPDGDELRSDPLVDGIRLRGIPFRGRRVDVG
jgi:glycogen debranching enzyme